MSIIFNDFGFLSTIIFYIVYIIFCCYYKTGCS